MWHLLFVLSFNFGAGGWGSGGKMLRTNLKPQETRNSLLRPGQTVVHWTWGPLGGWDPACLPFLPHPIARSSNQWEVGGVGKQAEREQLSAGEREQLPAFEGDSPTAPPNLLPPQGGLPGCLPPTPLWGSEEAGEEAS